MISFFNVHSCVVTDTACAKNKNLNRWFYFDDSSVSPCEENNVVVSPPFLCLPLPPQEYSY